MSLKLEKEQVLFLAGGLSEVLADLASPAAVPEETELELEEPVQPAWSVGSMQLAYDPANDRVVLVAREIGAPEDEDAPEDEEQDADGEQEPSGRTRPGRPAGRSGYDVEPGLGEAGPVAGGAGGTAGAGGEPGSAAGAGVARVVLTREQAAGVIEHGKRLLRAGRPPVPAAVTRSTKTTPAPR